MSKFVASLENMNKFVKVYNSYRSMKEDSDKKQQKGYKIESISYEGKTIVVIYYKKGHG